MAAMSFDARAAPRWSSEPEPAGRPRRRWLPLLALAGGALLYAAVWQLPSRFPGPANRARLTVSRLEGGDWVPVPDGAEVPSRARVRMTLEQARPASVVVIGLNATGRATLYLPRAGTAPRIEAGTSVLPGEHTLDGVAGPELFLAVLCNTPLTPATVVKAGERVAASAGAPIQVRTLDLGCPEARTLLRKEAAR